MASHNLFQASETGCAEPLNKLCGGTATPVPRHCDSRTTALFTLYNGIVHTVQRHCSHCATVLFTLCNGIVHTVKCGPYHRAVAQRKGLKNAVKCHFPFLFVICHTFVATRKCLCTKAFSAMVTNKQIKQKNLHVARLMGKTETESRSPAYRKIVKKTKKHIYK